MDSNSVTGTETGPPGRRSWRLTAREWRVLGFTLTYLSLALVASYLLSNGEFIFYFFIIGFLMLAVAAVHFRVQLHIAALWGLSLWGLAHAAGGLMPIPTGWPIEGESHVLYNLWLVPNLLKYDHVVHAYGFGLVTWICWQALHGAFRQCGIHVQPTFGLLVLCVAGGAGFGAANEVMEFFATITLPKTNVGGYNNTGWDLVANLVGSLAVAFVIYWRAER